MNQDLHPKPGGGSYAVEVPKDRRVDSDGWGMQIEERDR